MIAALLFAAATLDCVANDPPTVTSSSATYEGNQSSGIERTNAPLTVSVANLTANITPLPGVTGIRVANSDTNGNTVTVTTDGSGSIFTQSSTAYGIRVQNRGGDAGSFQFFTNEVDSRSSNQTVDSSGITNVFILTTNTIYGALATNTVTSTTTNKVVDGNQTNEVVTVLNRVYDPATSNTIRSVKETFRDYGTGDTNMIRYTTNVMHSATGNLGPLFDPDSPPTVPRGSIVIDNKNNITTAGANSHGIYAEAQPGMATFVEDWNFAHKKNPVEYGDGGTVYVGNSGNITTSGSDVYGIYAYSRAGQGGVGGDVNVVHNGTITTSANSAYGIYARSDGGRSPTDYWYQDSGSADNGLGGTVKISGGGTIVTYGNDAYGIYAISQAGSAAVYGSGRGTPGLVIVQGAWDITTYGNNAYGISAQGLSAGDVSVNNVGQIITHGPGAYGIYANGGNYYAYNRGQAGVITVTNTGSIITDGNSAHGIFAQTTHSGHGAPVVVVNNSYLSTSGDSADGVFARSKGGNGGNGSDGSIGSSPDRGGDGGNGGDATVTSNGTNITRGAQSVGVMAVSQAGNGGNGGDGGTWHSGARGGTGGNGGNVTVNGSGTIVTSGQAASGIIGFSSGGDGGDGGSSSGFGSGANGGYGGKGGTVTLNGDWNITTASNAAHGVWVKSVGGNAGSGGSGGWFSGGGSGGVASDGGSVAVTSGGLIITVGKESHGIYGESVGGFGGQGGGQSGIFYSRGGDGNSAGSGGQVSLVQEATGEIRTRGDYSHAMFAQSVGGGGGSGGAGSALVAVGGDGGAGGHGGPVFVINRGIISTYGASSRGIYAQSVGGGGGDGADSSGLVAVGGSGAGTSHGGTVTVTNTGTITTTAHGIFAQSVGGGGGDGGSSGGWFSIGGHGGNGGNADVVTVGNSGRIITTENNASAIQAQSVGGGGGNGGNSIAVGAFGSAAVGGSAGDGGRGERVTVNSTGGAIQTFGNQSHGIFAQSVGGGGGNGGFAFAGSIGTVSVSVGVGGSGGGGGESRLVEVNNRSTINTTGTNAHGIFAQSVGGGGGAGGFSIAASASSGLSGAFSIGGSGGSGGNGYAVTVTSTGAINTLQERSSGILAQSVGGGGGNGGFSIAGTLNLGPGGVTFGLGGSGGTGGNASTVDMNSGSDITTFGADSHALVAQSIGGGGGNGGFSINGTITTGIGLGGSIGGGAGGGGAADAVTAVNHGNITTYGNHAYGTLVQSVGGGGGDGGFSIGGVVSTSPALNFGVGGSGGGGGAGRAVSLNNTGNVFTYGETSYALFLQSVGGGGGSGGFAVSAALSTQSGGLSVGVGGSGGSGGNGGAVTLTSSGQLMTTNRGSHAILAQSVGGGGGAGGFSGSIAGGFGNGAKLGVSVGGSGGSGGSASAVTVTNTGTITTHSVASHGIFAQSVGGGGGDGGAGLAAAFGTQPASVNLALAIGGSGGSGGSGGAVTVRNQQTIETFGDNSKGIFAQSIGGGGGAGGFSASGTISPNSNAVQVAVSLGGSGGLGNNADVVTLTNSSAITTHGTNSIGIHAQSVGGGGGDGGISFAGTFSGENSKNLSVSIGGSGAGGGDASLVKVLNSGAIQTLDDDSYGILAQSIGGGGGNGGFSAAVALSLSATSSNGNNVNLSIAIGGSGGVGGKGEDVTVRNANTIVTGGDESHGILAQSIGGGGGNGGGSLAGSVTLSASSPGSAWNLAVAVGGGGGSGNTAGNVSVANYNDITSSGEGAHGIFAQSIGGGGGAGGSSRALTLALRGGGQSGMQSGRQRALTLSVGGGAGAGNDGGVVTVTNISNITTHGNDSYGIFAQSIGGGGGVGGNATHGIPATLPPGADKTGFFKSLDVEVGGNGGGSGNGADVTVQHRGNITTDGDGSYAVFAQSVGGGGGVGGSGVAGLTGKIAIGGAGGAAGNGGNVDITSSGNIETVGVAAHGILAQTIGGGGGLAGNVDRGLKNGAGPISSGNIGIGLAFGRSGGGAGNGGSLKISSDGVITTRGEGASAIFAQSIGGGGGLAGNLGNDFPGLGLLNFAGSVGGDGSGGRVDVTHTGNIYTYGTNGHGIFAQSAGSNNAAAVTVVLNGNLSAVGTNAAGIFAQSIAYNSQGDISITLTNGLVQGGSGGSGVRFENGNNNVLTNFGTLTTVDGIDGTAIIGLTRSETIENYGTIIGNVDLGVGNNALHNYAAGIFYPGTNVNLGATRTLINDGLLVPGGSNVILTTTLTGNFQQSAGGMLRIKIGSTNSYDRLAVTGTATLDGTLAISRFHDFLPKKRDTFTVLTTTGGRIAQFSTLDDPIKGNYSLQLSITNQANQVQVVTLQDDFVQFVKTPNQNYRAVAEALNSVSEDARMADLVEYLNTVPGPELPSKFDQISPQNLTVMPLIGLATASVQIGNLQGRMGTLLAGGGSGFSGQLSMFDPNGILDWVSQQPRFASTGPWEMDAMMTREALNTGLMRRSADNPWGVFIEGAGQFVGVKGDINANGYHVTSAGVTVGIDRQLLDAATYPHDQIVVGAALGYANSSTYLCNEGREDINSMQSNLYAMWFKDGWHAEAAGGGGYSLYDTRRQVLGQTANGDTHGRSLQGMLGGGYDWRMGRWTIGPWASAQYTSVLIDGFAEHGSMAPLSLSAQTLDSLQTLAGLHLAHTSNIGKTRWTPELRMAWQHESMDSLSTVDAQFASGAGNVFTTRGVALGRDAAAVGLGLTVQWSETFSTYVNYDTELARNNYSVHDVSAGARVSF